MTAVGECGVPVVSTVVCRGVLCDLDVGTDDVVCWLVGVLSASEVVTEEVDKDGCGVVTEVSEGDVVGKVMAVCWEIPEVLEVCVVLEAAAMGAECGVYGVLVVLCVPEVVCTTGVPVTPKVDVVKMEETGADVD